MAKVLGIEGSPRRGGNSDLLLDKFLEGAKSSGNTVEKIYACGLKIAPCDETNVCFKTGACRIKDDMVDVYKKLLDADHLVISTPTFFMGVPAQLKCMIDRCQALWAKRFILKEPLRDDEKERYGYLIATAGLNKAEAFIGTKQTIKSLFHVLGLKYKDELLIGGVDAKGDINKDKDALDKAFSLGKGIS